MFCFVVVSLLWLLLLLLVLLLLRLSCRCFRFRFLSVSCGCGCCWCSRWWCSIFYSTIRRQLAEKFACPVAQSRSRGGTLNEKQGRQISLRKKTQKQSGLRDNLPCYAMFFSKTIGRTYMLDQLSRCSATRARVGRFCCA